MVDVVPSDLPSSEVHVWALRPSEVTDPALLDAYRSLLSPDERVRHERFALASSRLQHLLGRALVRTVLARYVAQPARVLAFTEGVRGRPELVGSGGIRFNLSHTHDLLACAVTRDVDVGLDVEHLGRPIDVREVGASAFSPDEFAGLRALSTEGQRDRFFTLWTLKEAYLKARGLAVPLPLGAFTFNLDGPGETIDVRYEPPIVDDAAAWQFELRRPTPAHLVAIALKRGDGPKRRIVWRETVPLAGADQR